MPRTSASFSATSGVAEAALPADRDVRCVFYGDVFRPPGRMLGPADPWLDAADADEFERELLGALRQGRRYITEPAIRADVQERVAAEIGPDTRMLVGHSLGSVVAYEAMCAHPGWPVRALVTLGSPLGRGGPGQGPSAAIREQSELSPRTLPLWPARPSPMPVSDRRDERLALDGAAGRPVMLRSGVSLAAACLTRWPTS
jgi:pimeloyl-ACP methyl ester carboxylesterase